MDPDTVCWWVGTNFTVWKLDENMQSGSRLGTISSTSVHFVGSEMLSKDFEGPKRDLLISIQGFIITFTSTPHLFSDSLPSAPISVSRNLKSHSCEDNPVPDIFPWMQDSHVELNFMWQKQKSWIMCLYSVTWAPLCAWRTVMDWFVIQTVNSHLLPSVPGIGYRSRCDQDKSLNEDEWMN